MATDISPVTERERELALELRHSLPSGSSQTLACEVLGHEWIPRALGHLTDMCKHCYAERRP